MAHTNKKNLCLNLIFQPYIVTTSLGNCKVNVVPTPSSESTSKVPLWINATFRHTARPIPVPANRVSACSFSNMLNILFRCLLAIPIPLS